MSRKIAKEIRKAIRLASNPDYEAVIRQQQVDHQWKIEQAGRQEDGEEEEEFEREEGFSFYSIVPKYRRSKKRYEEDSCWE